VDFMGLLLGASLAMGATALGAAGILAFKRVGSFHFGLIIAFSGGVMAYSSVEMINESHALAGHGVALAGLLAGMCALLVMEKALPHAHLLFLKSQMSHAKKKAALLAGTITIHNIPEGFAIASAFATSSSLGWLVAVAIAVQDVPEGLIVSAPVAAYGVSRAKSFAWGVFSGVVEFAAAIGGFLFLRSVSVATPFALGFSGGAMSYVVLFELLPDAVRSEKRHLAGLMFVAGIAVAYILSLLVGF
jgi:zinc transporter, ZIP family